jgi:hypothetical protein
LNPSFSGGQLKKSMVIRGLHSCDAYAVVCRDDVIIFYFPGEARRVVEVKNPLYYAPGVDCLKIALGTIALSMDGHYLAMSSTGYKCLFVFQVSRTIKEEGEEEGEKVELALILYHWLEKALTKMLFHKEASGEWLLYYSDKFGDFRGLPISSAQAELEKAGNLASQKTAHLLTTMLLSCAAAERHANQELSRCPDREPLLGHLSLLTDFTVTSALILTMDRDEKIRLSHRRYPFIVMDYLLGHTAYISTHVWLTYSSASGTNTDSKMNSNTESLEKVLITAGGDDALFLWQNIEENGSRLTNSPPALLPIKIPLNSLLHREASQWNVQSLYPLNPSTAILIIEEFPSTLFILSLQSSHQLVCLAEMPLSSSPDFPIESDKPLYACQVANLPSTKPNSFLIACYEPIRRISHLFLCQAALINDPSLSTCPHPASASCSVTVKQLPLPDSPPALTSIPLLDFVWRKSSLRKYFEEDANLA